MISQQTIRLIGRLPAGSLIAEAIGPKEAVDCEDLLIPALEEGEHQYAGVIYGILAGEKRLLGMTGFVYRDQATAKTAAARLISLSKLHAGILQERKRLNAALGQLDKLLNDLHDSQLWSVFITDATITEIQRSD